MPEWARYLLAIAGTLSGIALAYIVAGVRKVSESQTEQKQNMAVMQVNLTSVADKVDDLHKWRNELQAKEYAKLEDELAELKKNKS